LESGSTEKAGNACQPITLGQRTANLTSANALNNQYGVKITAGVIASNM
jgi:hypothetical protein